MARDMARALTERQILFEQLPDRITKEKGRPVPTKKRSAPGSGSGAGSNQAQSRQPPRRVDDPHRKVAGGSHEQIRHMAHRMSFDTAQRNGRQGQQFVTNYPELLPLDISSATASPDSTGTPSTSHRSAGGFPQPPPGTSSNPLYKLDAMMFPSEDPFAYPNQPVMDFGVPSHHRRNQPGHPSSGSQQQDAVQFYMSNVYGDIEGQVLGPIPPYFVQASHNQGLDLSAQMYNASGILPASLQPSHVHQAQQQAAQQQQQQQQQRDIEELLADPAFEVFSSNYRAL